MTPKEYMALPYTYILIFDKGSETWTGKIKEFPGCISQGDSGLICMINTYEVALDWIEAALELGQEIPEPEREKEKP